MIRNECVHPCSSGNIRNTEKLSYDKQRQYEILVTAYDCGQKPAAQDTLVQVDVKPVCKPGWQGEPDLYYSCYVRTWGTEGVWYAHKSYNTCLKVILKYSCIFSQLFHDITCILVKTVRDNSNHSSPLFKFHQISELGRYC